MTGREALDAMGIVRFCKDRPELVDELLVDILDAFSRQDEAIRADIAQRLRELEELERAQALERQELKTSSSSGWRTGGGRFPGTRRPDREHFNWMTKPAGVCAIEPNEKSSLARATPMPACLALGRSLCVPGPRSRAYSAIWDKCWDAAGT